MPSLQSFKISRMYRYYTAVREVSLELQAGECFALLGPNGAGKTTLLRIFATLLRPTQGWFEVMGKNGLEHREEVRRYIFFIGHETGFYDDLTVVENIEFTLSLRGWVPSFSEIRAALDVVGMGPYGMQKGRYLSAGMQKRLAFARALLVNPRLLLLDEAYADLDEQGIDILNECIRKFLKKGTAVLMSSHDRARLAEVASKAGVLRYKELREFPIQELDRAIF